MKTSIYFPLSIQVTGATSLFLFSQFMQPKPPAQNPGSTAQGG